MSVPGHTPIAELPIPARTKNALLIAMSRGQIEVRTLQDLKSLADQDFAPIPNIGITGISAIRAFTSELDDLSAWETIMARIPNA